MLRDNPEEWDGVGGVREVQVGGSKCIPVADSCCRVAETHAVL